MTTSTDKGPSAAGAAGVAGAGEPSGPPRTPWLRRRVLDGNRLHKWLVAILAIALVGTWGFHLYTVQRLSGQVAEERQRLYDEVLGEEARSAVEAIGVALGWGAAEALGRDDMATIDATITRLVKVGPVLQVAVLDADSVVRVATNKKLEGVAGARAFPGLPLAAAKLTVFGGATDDGPLVVVAPLYPAGERDPSARVGVAVLSYARPAPGPTPLRARPPAE